MGISRKHFIPIFATAGILLSTLGPGCASKYSFEALPVLSQLSGGPSSSGGGSAQAEIPPTSSTGTTVSVKTLQPALAVRGISCLACHGQMQANVITDFGYGNNWFLDQDKNGYTDPKNFVTNGWYSPYALQILKSVNGQLFVPSSMLPLFTVAILVILRA
jgi:hypothetical protein